MTITRHKTAKEYRRYAGEDAGSDRADAAMAKVIVNRFKTLAIDGAQAVENDA